MRWRAPLIVATLLLLLVLGMAPHCGGWGGPRRPRPHHHGAVPRRLLGGGGGSGGSLAMPEVCGWTCLKLRWLQLGPLLPKTSDLSHHPKEFAGRMWAFIVAAAVLVSSCAAFLEVLSWVWRRRSSTSGGFSRLPCAAAVAEKAEVGGAREFVSRTLETQQPSLLLGGVAVHPSSQCLASDKFHYFVQTSTFAAYLVFYHTLCWASVAFCTILSMVSKGAGMDWEVYLAWLAWMMLSHLLCFCRRFFVGLRGPPEAGACAAAMLKTVLPILSEPLDGFRDPVLAAIYLSSGSIGVGPALLTMFGTVLPFFAILHDRSAFFELRRGYFPIMELPGAGAGHAFVGDEKLRALEDGGSWKARLKVSAAMFAKDQSSPLEQYLVVLEEVLQAFAAFFFWFNGGDSAFSLASGAISFAKVLLVLLCRPFVLGCVAALRRPWLHLSTRDILQAMQCSWTASWLDRCRAVCEMLRDEEFLTDDVLFAAARGLQVVFQEAGLQVGGCKHAAGTSLSLCEEELATLSILCLAKGQLAKLLSHSNECVRGSARDALEAAGVSEEDVEDLHHLAEDACSLSSESTVKRKLEMLGSLRAAGVHAAPFASDVAAVLDDADDSVQAAAAETVSAMGFLSFRIVDPLEHILDAMLQRGDGKVRREVAQALGTLGPHAWPHLSTIMDWVADLSDNGDDDDQIFTNVITWAILLRTTSYDCLEIRSGRWSGCFHMGVLLPPDDAVLPGSESWHVDLHFDGQKISSSLQGGEVEVSCRLQRGVGLGRSLELCPVLEFRRNWSRHPCCWRAEVILQAPRASAQQHQERVCGRWWLDGLQAFGGQLHLRATSRSTHALEDSRAQTYHLPARTLVPGAVMRLSLAFAMGCPDLGKLKAELFEKEGGMPQDNALLKAAAPWFGTTSARGACSEFRPAPRASRRDDRHRAGPRWLLVLRPRLPSQRPRDRSQKSHHHLDHVARCGGHRFLVRWHSLGPGRPLVLPATLQQQRACH
mmetsp:Transcript_68679/g.223529  ORF Transcript_68679/g.223529 Transcript_68679/m.223529 type:complete len:992 (+) Transcript_68679:201-3176(+)